MIKNYVLSSSLAEGKMRSQGNHTLNQRVLLMMGFKIIGVQAQNTSPNARLKKGLRSRPSTSVRPLMTSPKYRPKKRAQFNLQKAGNVIKEFVLKENTQFPPIRKT